jgi:hypothetical protein
MEQPKARKPNPWLEHVKAVRASEPPGKSAKEIMALALASYKKKEKVPKA